MILNVIGQEFDHSQVMCVQVVPVAPEHLAALLGPWLPFQRAGAQHLVLTHLYPVCDAREVEVQARRVFAGRLTVAHDALVMEV